VRALVGLGEHGRPGLEQDLRPGELRCPACFNRDVVESLRRGILDQLMHRLGREPRHCRFCGRRFYVNTKKMAAQS
jgi:hypothetical protein